MTQVVLNLDHDSCRPVLSKLIVRSYSACPVFSPDDMTEKMISVCTLRNEISGLMNLFHVRRAFALVFETTLY